MRGTERSLWSRLHLARRRFTRATAGVAATAVALILTVGGFIFYNTNVLQSVPSPRPRRRSGAPSTSGATESTAGIAQPPLAATNLRVEIYPERREAEIRGTYVLVNDSSAAIDSIHVATVPGVETGAVSFDRPASPRARGRRPRLPHLCLGEAAPARRLAATHLRGAFRAAWLPQQRSRCLRRRERQPLHESGLVAGHRLSAESRARWRRSSKAVWTRPTARRSIARRRRGAPDPSRRRPDHLRSDRGDERGPVAVAPGALRRTWTEGGRRYFHYVTDVPINNQYGVFSASYALHEEQWNPSTGSGPAVAIQIFHHPGHAENLARMVASVRASLDHYTRQFGPYPYSYLRLIENPARGMGVATEAATVEYGEGFSLLNPGNGPQDLDLVFAVVAHGVARGWWGMQVAPADVEGAGLLDVSLETYSAMRVVEETLGPEHLRRYLRSMREGLSPPRRARLRHCFGPPTRSPSPAKVPLRCMRCASTSARSG